MSNKTSREEGREEEGTDFSFDPGSQIELRTRRDLLRNGRAHYCGFLPLSRLR